MFCKRQKWLSATKARPLTAMAQATPRMANISKDR